MKPPTTPQSQLNYLAQIAFGSRVRPSPYFEATLRWGASAFTTYNHMYMPSVFESAVRDYHYLTTGVTLWDVAGERQVQITGADAGRFVQYLTPRNLTGLAADRCRYVLLTNARGGVINDPVLLKLAEDKYWLSLADSDALLWCQGVALHMGLDVEITQPDISPLQLQGPDAMSVARALFGDWVQTLPYFHCRQVSHHGIPLVVSRTGWSGEKGFEIYLCDGEHGDALWEEIMAAGERWGIRPATPSAIRRIEGGLLSLGADSNFDDTPYHLGLGRLVDLDGGFDFIGKEALQKQQQDGITRQLVGVEIDGAPLPRPLVRWWHAYHQDDNGGASASDGRGEWVGKIRSAVYSAQLEKNIGFAMLNKPHDALGTGITTTTEYGDTRCATVCPLVFIPSKAR